MIYIIGAGPIGSYCAYLLANAGEKVAVIEKKGSKYLGLPVQCTGLLTQELEKISLVNPKRPECKKFLVNILHSAEINSRKKKVRINSTEYLVDRRKFDQFIAERAMEAGAEFRFNQGFEGYDKENNSIIVRSNAGKSRKNGFRCIQLKNGDVIIGADGPVSGVEDAFFPGNAKDFYFALQAVVNIKSDGKTYQTFFDKNFSPTLFAWLVPENKTTARVGVVAKGNPKRHFSNFLRFLGKKHKIRDIRKNIGKKQAGLIPIYNPKNRIEAAMMNKGSKIRVFLVGDAASQVKATTLGGIIPGLKAAEIIADRILGKKASFWKLNLGLKLHLRLLNIISRFDEDDFSRLIEMVDNRRIKKILGKTSRDRPILLLMKLFFAKPSLIRFAGKLL